jgi:hypothetical protein
VDEAVELELRQLPGVRLVSFSEEDEGGYVELVVAPGTDREKVREEASRALVNHLEGPAEVRVVEPPQPREEKPEPAARKSARVQLKLLLPSDGGAAIEVQLSRGAQQFSSRAVAGDTAAVGRAVIEALRGFGAETTYDLVGFHALPSEWGAGVLAVLRDPTTGEYRRGVASGLAPADAAARAVLDALNRSLEPALEATA